MRCFSVGICFILSVAIASGQPTQPSDEVSVLKQPVRLLPDASAPPVAPLPLPPKTDGLQLPPWLLPDAPKELGDRIHDPQVQLVTASAAVSRRAAALYAQAEKLSANARSRGDLSDIIELCDAGLADEPSIELKRQLGRLAAWACNRRGEMLIEEGDERAAFDDFSRAVEMDAACWSAFHNRAITYATYGQHEEALRDFATAIELNPEAVAAYRNRAGLFVQLGRLQDAEADLSSAIAHAANDGDLRSLRGDIYRQMGRSDLATQEYDAAVQLGSHLASALAHRAISATQQGNYDLAIVSFDEALRNDPYHVATYRGVAWLLATCPEDRYRDPQKALEAARRAQRFGTENDPVILDTLAAALANVGDYELAIPYAQQAARQAAFPLRGEIEARIVLYQQRKPFRSK